MKLQFNTRKPEELLQRIIESSTNKNDIILDFFAGSGTMGAVAHKMGRQWIMVEQMDYIETITKERMKKVIAGEQGGISKSVNWQGGGDFVYMELKEYNQQFKGQIENATTKEQLLEIFNDICINGLVNYKIDLKELQEDIYSNYDTKEINTNSEFMKQDLETMKNNLYVLLNKNLLYVPLNAMNDSRFAVSKDDKKINEEFYKNI